MVPEALEPGGWNLTLCHPVPYIGFMSGGKLHTTLCHWGLPEAFEALPRLRFALAGREHLPAKPCTGRSTTRHSEPEVAGSSPGHAHTGADITPPRYGNTQKATATKARSRGDLGRLKEPISMTSLLRPYLMKRLPQALHQG